MTPEQIAEHLIREHCDCGWINVMLSASIATALREARNQALEEAAEMLDADAAFAKQVLYDAHGVPEQVRRKTDGHLRDQIVRAELAASAVRKLKHKDGQP